eukprot:2614351-Pleurochrysis_carterae.AAC.1
MYQQCINFSLPGGCTRVCWHIRTYICTDCNLLVLIRTDNQEDMALAANSVRRAPTLSESHYRLRGLPVRLTV